MPSNSPQSRLCLVPVPLRNGGQLYVNPWCVVSVTSGMVGGQCMLQINDECYEVSMPSDSLVSLLKESTNEQ
jgi:hypothetical protein